jgi:hypothetical protein
MILLYFLLGYFIVALGFFFYFCGSLLVIQVGVDVPIYLVLCMFWPWFLIGVFIAKRLHQDSIDLGEM